MTDDETWFERWGTLGPRAYLDAVDVMPALALAVQDRVPEDQAALREWHTRLTYPDDCC